MGFFDRDLFDFNNDGEVDAFELDVNLQMMASSRQEADGVDDAMDEYGEDW